MTWIKRREPALVDFGRIDKMPDDSAMLTEKFLPSPLDRKILWSDLRDAQWLPR